MILFLNFYYFLFLSMLLFALNVNLASFLFIIFVTSLKYVVHVKFAIFFNTNIQLIFFCCIHYYKKIVLSNLILFSIIVLWLQNYIDLKGLTYVTASIFKVQLKQ